MVSFFAVFSQCDGKRLLPVPVCARVPILICFLIFPLQICAAETLEVIRKIPHTGYSEGIDYHEGFLWQALPKEILKLDPKDGTVVGRFLPGSEYSESLIWLGKTIINVSFSDNGIYVGKLEGGKLAFERKGETPEKHAWGMTHDGKNTIVTGDYSNKLYFLDSKFKVKRTITTPVKDLEDLAWDGKGIWASSFTATRGIIFRVDPKTGNASPFFSLPDPDECPVIDGIAFDGKNLWVTGKNCLSVYYVKRPTEAQINAKPAVPTPSAKAP